MRKTLLMAAVAALLPLAAQAHMTWLLPNTTLVTNRDGVVSVDAAVSENLFQFERALKLEQLRITGPGGLVVQPEGQTAARHHESFDLKLPKEGTYRISNTSRALMGSYKLGGETKRFRATPDTLAKELPAGAELLGLVETSNRQQTFVSREEPGEVAFAPEGQGLEWLPLGPVTDLSAGDSIRLRLLLDGQPQADATVTVRPGGNRYRYKTGEITLKTDAQGVVAIPLAEPGAYWVGASAGERPGPGMPAGTRDKPVKRAQVSATFEALPR